MIHDNYHVTHLYVIFFISGLFNFVLKSFLLGADPQARKLQLRLLKS